MSALPSKASSGHDNLSNILFKEIIVPLAQILMEVFNKSMTVGEFPNIMKLAEVVPLYKSKEHYLETIIDRYPYLPRSQRSWKK